MKPWLDLNTVSMPARIAALDRDARGYPKPFGTMPDDFRVINMANWARAVRDRLCGICGHGIGVHIAFVGGPGSIKHRTFTDLGMHRECAEYALAVCPFLAMPTSFSYARTKGEGTTTLEDVSDVRPDKFGLGVTKTYEYGLTPQNTPAILAGRWGSLTWYRHGQVLLE